MKTFYSNGKLLLTGEYVVLDGALALAVPTKFGQSLNIETIAESRINWKSIDYKGETWFEASFTITPQELVVENCNHTQIAERLLQIFNAVQKLNPSFLKKEHGFTIKTQLGFQENWGLGSSSTLINNIANWAQINPYSLLDLTFGGSGYDIACASNNSAITYQIINNSRLVEPVSFNPDFSDQLFFIHLNEKQNSREGIKHYNENKGQLNSEIKKINTITSQVFQCTTLGEFESLMNSHEQIISNITNRPTIKSVLFNDYSHGIIKSLGAWGGDFVLATGTPENMRYFKDKGFKTILAYKDMIL